MVKRITAKANKGNMLKVLDTDSKLEEWYFIEEKIQKFVSTIQTGDIVEFQASKNTPNNVGKNMITYITKVGGATPAPEFVAPTNGSEKISMPDPRESTTPTKPYVPYGQKSPEESERIARLSIASSASSALNSLSGQVDANTIVEVWNKLYTNIYEKVMAK